MKRAAEPTAYQRAAAEHDRAVKAAVAAGHAKNTALHRMNQARDGGCDKATVARHAAVFERAEAAYRSACAAVETAEKRAIAARKGADR